MNNSDLKNFTTEKLQKKSNSSKTLTGILIALSIALAFFAFREYLQDSSINWLTTTMVFCCLGGAASTYQEYKDMNVELKNRNKT